MEYLPALVGGLVVATMLSLIGWLGKKLARRYGKVQCIPALGIRRPEVTASGQQRCDDCYVVL